MCKVFFMQIGLVKGGGACWVIQGIAGNQSTYSSLTYIALIFSGKLNYSCYREIKS